MSWICTKYGIILLLYSFNFKYNCSNGLHNFDNILKSMQGQVIYDCGGNKIFRSHRLITIKNIKRVTSSTCRV